MIGNGKSDSGDFIKSISDVTNAVPNELNPSYYKLYELDAKLPDDWNLWISIQNKGMVSNSLIGTVMIDLEDRLLGEKKL